MLLKIKVSVYRIKKEGDELEYTKLFNAQELRISGCMAWWWWCEVTGNKIKYKH
jgi:hypothetical protein